MSGSLSFSSLNHRVRCRDRQLVLNAQTQVMGILNVTPDSFYDGGRFVALSAALSQARLMVSEGASVVDIGGQSTRPGYREITPEEEIERVVPVLKALVPAVAAPLSIDSYKPAVVEAALAAGAHLVNDIYGLQRYPEIATLAARVGAAVVAMHQEENFAAGGGDVIARVRAFFEKTLAIAEAAGLARSQIILDPGIGFGKSHAQNVELMARLGELHDLGCPLLLAASRKSVISYLLDLPVEERLEGTLATTAAAFAQGISLVRVHDVKPNARVLAVLSALRAAGLKA